MICKGITYTAGMMVLALAATASPVRGDAAGPPMLRLDEPTGACCALGGVCWDDSTATACWTSHAGIWQGPGSLCETTDCYGACCAAGACYECDQALCLTLYSGVWQGGGASCDPNPCSPPTGACCLAGGACEELPESVCESAGGAFMGLTIPCEPSPCTTDYCTAGSAACEEHIARVQVGRLDNRSGCERYADYTHRLTDVVAGEQYLITVTNGLPFEGDVCSIWIDWNNDHIFEDVAPEWIGDVVGGGASPPYRLTLTVPAEVLLGPKRVRIRIDYSNRDPDPCGIRAYGEVEDYALQIMPFPGACCLPCGYCRRLAEPECIAAGGTVWAPDASCEPTSCPHPEMLTLVADRDCYRAGDAVTVEVWMNNVAEGITGGQFFLSWDASKLAMVDAVPGDHAESDPLNPFEMEIRERISEGELDYAVGVHEPGAYPDPDGDDGSSGYGTRRMAVLSFTALVNICDEHGLLVWRAHSPPSRLSDSFGHPVIPELVDASVADHVAPAITCPADVEIGCEEPRTPDFTGWALAHDTCDSAPLVEWSDTEYLTGCNGTGTIARNWTATDHCGNRNSCLQTITIVDRTPPELICPDDLVLECGPESEAEIAAWLASTHATDDCGAAVVTNDYTGLAGGCGGAGTATVVFTATDECGLTSTCERSIAISDTTPPVLDCPPDLVVECGPGAAAAVAAWLASATATDSCGSVSVTNDFGGLSDACAATGSAVVTFTATDECGLTATCTRQLTVVDTLPPTFTCPADVVRNADPGCYRLTLSLAEIGWPSDLHDECSEPEDWSVLWVRSDGAAPLAAPFTKPSTTITWAVVDECGNVSPPQIQTITVLPFNTAQVEIELEGELLPDTLVRCVKFVFANSASGATVERYENVEFVRQPDGNAFASLTFSDLPCDVYDCVTAEDELHSLGVRLAPGLTPDGAAWAVAFTGPAERLVQGDLIDVYDEPADVVDLLDFAVFLHQWGRVYDTSLPPDLPDGDGHTPCGLYVLHADLNGDGVVDASDYAFISAHFGELGDVNCDAEPGDVAEPGRVAELGCVAEPGRVAPEWDEHAAVATDAVRQSPQAARQSPRDARPSARLAQQFAPAARQFVTDGTKPASIGTKLEPQRANTPAPAPRGAAPRWRVTFSELEVLGLSQLAVADLNGDGVLDLDDVAAFEQGARPAIPAVEQDHASFEQGEPPATAADELDDAS